MAEGLDHLLALGHLLHEAVEPANGLLLAQKVPGGPAAVPLDKGQNQHQGHKYHQGQRDAVIEHEHDGDDQGDEGGDDLGDRLGQKLTHGVHIVGVQAHQIAVGIGVKKAQGETLHLFKHLIPQLAQSALGDVHHNPVVGEGGQRADEIDDAHEEDVVIDHPHVGICAVFHQLGGNGSQPGDADDVGG